MSLVLRILPALIMIIAFSIITPKTFAADDEAKRILNPACETAPDSTLCKSGSEDQTVSDNAIFGPNGIITKAANLLSLAVGVAAVVLIMVGGMRYILASGDPQNLKGAKDTILFAIIGLIVAIAAQAIVVFVLKAL